MEEKQVITLVKQARVGNKQAFATLYRHWVKPIYAYFYVRVAAHQDAEDLTTQTFMKALKAMTNFEGRSSFATWLYAIARNNLIDFYRQRKFEPGLREELTASPAEDDCVIRQAQKQARVEKILESLPQKYAQVLKLRFMQSLSVAEAAKVMGISEVNVKVRQTRALYQARKLAEAGDKL